MKLTSKGRYAVMAMADLAKNYVKEPISLTEISLRQGISIDYLEQLFLKLRKNNLVQSVRGPSGGYILNKSPDELTATKSPFLETAKDNKFCDFIKDDIERTFQTLEPSLAFKQKILLS